MFYRVESINEEHTEEGFLVIGVSYWYNDNAQEHEPPDVYHEIRVPQPLLQTWKHDFDNLGQRLTVSGARHHGWQEIDGRWQPVPEDGPVDDPWLKIDEQELDPTDQLVPFIESIGPTLKDSGVYGNDSFTDRDFVFKKREHQVAKHPSLQGLVREFREIK